MKGGRREEKRKKKNMKKKKKKTKAGRTGSVWSQENEAQVNKERRRATKGRKRKKCVNKKKLQFDRWAISIRTAEGQTRQR